MEGEIPSPPEIKNVITGKWTNIHFSNPDLAGVLVQQFPDNPYEAPAWEGKHPAMILFVMWNGRVNQLGYEPSGKVRENFWWNIESSEHDYSYIWEQLDYPQGSDSNFMHHRDPRTTNKKQIKSEQGTPRKPSD